MVPTSRDANSLCLVMLFVVFLANSQHTGGCKNDRFYKRIGRFSSFVDHHRREQIRFVSLCFLVFFFPAAGAAGHTKTTGFISELACPRAQTDPLAASPIR